MKLGPRSPDILVLPHSCIKNYLYLQVTKKSRVSVSIWEYYLYKWLKELLSIYLLNISLGNYILLKYLTLLFHGSQSQRHSAHTFKNRVIKF